MTTNLLVSSGAGGRCRSRPRRGCVISNLGKHPRFENETIDSAALAYILPTHLFFCHSASRMDCVRIASPEFLPGFAHTAHLLGVSCYLVHASRVARRVYVPHALMGWHGKKERRTKTNTPREASLDATYKGHAAARIRPALEKLTVVLDCSLP
ncbi:hypothetical protein BD311DRAFT_532818 [Dichomitus squalens]|uniref:Uncharacterized protein n=1 Tax=Dichomitus squalens TaxID=114155 RepID=A0A4V2JZF1_9APHY|nr:hypothetical protein BD311DRAFT_532818 [Dichomitus squalens]